MLTSPLRQPVPTRRRLACVLAVALLATAGCTGETGEDGSAPSGRNAGVTVLQPGSPGDPVTTLGPDDELPEAPEWNHADVAFMQMMVPHHEQALVMSKLATTRAESPEVASLARRIAGAQGPEIITMAGWLEQRGIEVPRAGDDPDDVDHSKHGHSGMAGMLTPEQMEALSETRGRRFDRLFLRGMIGHHQGAVDMAETVGAEGSDLQVSELAADVAAGQAAEIRRMRQLLRDL